MELLLSSLMLGGYYMLFVRTKMFGIRIAYERWGGLRLHAHFSRIKLKNLRENDKNICMIWRVINSIRNLRKKVRYLCQQQLLTAVTATKDGWKIFLLNNITRRITLRKKRNFEVEDWTEKELIKEFRISKSEINCICNLIKDSMLPVGYRSIDLLLEQKVLICLKTLGSESFQNYSKDFIDVAEPTVSRVLCDFIETMVKLAPDFIFMPRNNNEVCDKKKGLL